MPPFQGLGLWQDAVQHVHGGSPVHVLVHGAPQGGPAVQLLLLFSFANEGMVIKGRFLGAARLPEARPRGLALGNECPQAPSAQSAACRQTKACAPFRQNTVRSWASAPGGERPARPLLAARPPPNLTKPGMRGQPHESSGDGASRRSMRRCTGTAGAAGVGAPARVAGGGRVCWRLKRGCSQEPAGPGAGEVGTFATLKTI